MTITTARGCETITIEDGTEFRFFDVGTGGPPVVLLHGLFGSPSNWLSLMHDLAGERRFLALQLPIDHDKTRRHTAFRSLDQLTNYLIQFTNAMQLDQVALCGNSLGGQVALHYYLLHPERVERLILSGSAGLFERSLSGGRPPRVCREFIREQACEIFHDPVHVTPELVDDIYEMLSDRHYRRFLLRVAKATRDHYMLEDLAKVHVPTLIVWGRDDSITPPFVAEQFSENIQTSELVFLDDCGHAPPIEQPEQFSRLLHRFLTDGTRQSGNRTPCRPR